MSAKVARGALSLPLYRLPYFRVPVTPLGEHHARHGGVPENDHEKENGYEGSADFSEIVAADTSRVEILVAIRLQT